MGVKECQFIKEILVLENCNLSLKCVCLKLYEPCYSFFYIYSQNRHPENLYCTFGNCEEDFPKKPVGRLSADTLPTVYRQATDS